MNKLQSLLSAFVCALCISSCSSDTTNKADGSKTSTTPQQFSENAGHTMQINSYFIDLLKSHKIENIEESDTGIFLPDSKVGLEGQVNQIKQLDGGKLAAELEMRVTLPDRRVIDEFLASVSETTSEVDVVKSALANFTLTTFHPIYAAFIDPKDPHVQRERWTINGKEREVILGDSLETVYEGTNEKTAANSNKEAGGVKTDAEKKRQASAAQAWWEERLKQAVCARKLDDQDHWVKFFVAHKDGKLAEVAAMLDNSPDPEMSKFFEQLEHPKGVGEMYTIKRFLVVRHTDSK